MQIHLRSNFNRRAVDRVLGSSPTRLVILSFLAHHGPATPPVVTRQTGVSATAAYISLGDLENAGYVRLGPSGGPPRSSKTVSITAMGREALVAHARQLAGFAGQHAVEREVNT